ncbi:mechanosensitive ion channel family protein [Anaerohalosphaeraceae bacterium U12dextr]
MKNVVLMCCLVLLCGSNRVLMAAQAEQSAPTETAQTPSKVDLASLTSMDPQKMWDTISNYIATQGMDLLFRLITAALIFYVGRWVARVLTNLLENVLNRAKVDPTLSKFVRNLLYFGLLVFVAIAALSRLGVETTSLVAVIGAAGLAVGLALQGSLSNFAAGVLLIIFKPFRVGDFVEVAGAKGVVQEIQIFTTVLHSPDNVRIIIPNSQVTGANIINYTANDKRRVDLVFGISYGDDITKAKQVITSVLLSDSRILRDPAPVVAVLGLGDSSVNIAVRPWVKAPDYWPTYFELNEKIKVSLEQNGLSIPFPQRDIHIRTGSLKV